MDFLQFVSRYEALEISAETLINSESIPHVSFISPRNYVNSPYVARVYGDEIAESIMRGHRRGLDPVSSIAEFIESRGLERLASDCDKGDVMEAVEVSDAEGIYHLMREKDYHTFVIGEEVGLMAYMRLTDLSLDVGNWVVENDYENSKRMREAIKRCKLPSFKGRRYPKCAIFKDISKALVEEFHFDMKEVEGMARFLPPMRTPYAYAPSRTPPSVPALELAYA